MLISPQISIHEHIFAYRSYTPLLLWSIITVLLWSGYPNIGIMYWYRPKLYVFFRPCILLHHKILDLVQRPWPYSPVSDSKSISWLSNLYIITLHKTSHPLITMDTMDNETTFKSVKYTSSCKLQQVFYTQTNAILWLRGLW